MRRRRHQSGFTLIELMIVVAIIGILTSIAAPNFLGTMRRAKLSEASLAIDKARQNLRLYYSNHNDMPPSSTGFMPPADMCANGTGKTAVVSQDVWNTDPAFAALEFFLPDPGYFQYSWVRTSATTGSLLARTDMDCDKFYGTIVASFTVVNEGVVGVSVSKFPDD